MGRVDFYVLSDPVPSARLRFACRLTEKAYRGEHRIYIHTGSDSEAARIDELLWTFRDGSFVPHERVGDASAEASRPERSPVLIGCHDDSGSSGCDVLINLSDEVPDCAAQFERIAEIVDESTRVQGRERFKVYRKRGYELQTHTLA